MRTTWVTAALVGGLLGAAAAHPPPRTTAREVIRLQGTRAPTPDGAGAGHRLTVAALGGDYPFAATTWQVLVAPGQDGPPPPSTPDHPGYTLEGDRETLSRFTGARPEQTVTLLVERRPGASTLFVLALDLCPPR